MNKKILTAFLILIFTTIVLNINNVLGYGIVSHAWKNDVDGTPYLLFRTYTSPHSSTVKSYHNTRSTSLVDNTNVKYTYNGTKYSSKWIYTYTDASVVNPDVDQFRTVAFAFHKEPLCKYYDSTAGTIGYNYSEYAIDYDINTISKAYTNSKAVYANIANNIGDRTDYAKAMFFSVLRNHGTYSETDWGTKIKVENLYAQTPNEYRYAIVDIGGNNVYVADNMIYGENVKNFVAEAKKAGAQNECYVSNIIVSKAYGENNPIIYEVSVTARDFFLQHDKNWDSTVKGKGDKAMGSAANLYDNKLVLPQLSKRTVLVRHINIGNNTTVSETIVANGSRIKLPAGTVPKLTLPKINGTLTTTNKYNETYEEYFENSIDIEEVIEKSALSDTSTYKCIGHNVGVALDEASALDVVEDNIKKGTYTTGRTVKVPAKEAGDDSDVIVIDFYYSEYDQDVYVNHVYVNSTQSKVVEVKKQTIKPNDTAIMDDVIVNRKNDDTYVKEVYARKLGSTVTAKVADSLKDEANVKYLGYEILTAHTDISKLVGNKIEKKSVTSKEQANLKGDNIQVNFYYSIETLEYEQEPDRYINGKLLVEPLGTKGECTDNDTLPTSISKAVTSVPTNSQVKVGITEIPRYMVGTVKMEKTLTDGATYNLNIQLLMGEKVLNVNVPVPYKASYYRVTDMTVYELKTLQVYDADNGLFTWDAKDLELKDKKISFERSGRYGKITDKNENNLNNYVELEVQYTNPRSGQRMSSFMAPLDILYTEDFNSVDANKDGAITDEDKTFAEQKLKDLSEAKNTAQTNYDNKHTQYQSAKAERNTLKTTYNNAIITLAEKLQKYEDAAAEKAKKEEALLNANKDLNTKKSELKTKESELINLQQDIQTKENTKAEKEEELNKANSELNRLKNAWDTAVSDRQELEAKANCQDSVDENIYINLDQSKKDELEQCKLYKEEYQQNLRDKVVENKEKDYYDYLYGDYQTTKKEYNNADGALNEAKKAEKTLKSDISELNTDIFKQSNTISMMQYNLDKYENYTYTPAKSDYENYLNGDYAKAKAAYDEHVDNQIMENAEKSYGEASAAKTKAEEEYASYNTYKNNLYQNFDTYKEKYDIYLELEKETDAIKFIETLNTKFGTNFKFNIKVQNMMVNVYETVNGKTNKLSSIYTADISESEQKNESTYDLKNYLAEYVAGKPLPVVEPERPRINQALYSGIYSTKISLDDYINNTEKIARVSNGVRTLSGIVEYEAKSVIGSSYVDTVYFSDKSNEDKTVAFELAEKKITQKYAVNKTATTYEEKYRNVKPINIYTPITVSIGFTADEEKIIDQSPNNTSIGSKMIQVNTPFKITLAHDNPAYGTNTANNRYNQASPYNNQLKKTDAYRYAYYVKFDFDVHEVYINDNLYKKGERIPAGTWVGVIPALAKENATLSAQPYGGLDNSSALVSDEIGTFTVRAVAHNIAESILKKSIRYSSIDKMLANNSGMDTLIYNICDSSSYFAEETYSVNLINRLYDFRVTDVKDVNWKNVFRTTTDNVTNAHTGNIYYSGVQKWNTTSKKFNEIISRTTSEIGKNPLRTLPIGPYKNTDMSYIKAPKLGYRFSFDFKLTGSYYKIGENATLEPNKLKTAHITTKFYYISKDGQTYYNEAAKNKEGIYLFYKTDAGKYVRIDDNGGGYSLTFTPNDGYRYIETNDSSNMAKKSVIIGNLRTLNLKYNMAAPTISRDAIIYYGEYKLPNSTIAVVVDEFGNYDINKDQLTNGYIGVVFDIITKNNDLELRYSESTVDDSQNTTQWDYEGHLGFKNYGSTIGSKPLTMKLEKGTWNIDNTRYNDIKGTVILYDIDARAATDYE